MMQDNIEVIDLVPKFLDFYKKAVGHDSETRFDLWQKHYGFAAVPPGEEGARLARRQLDEAWDKYESVIPFLEQWSPDIQAIRRHLSKIKSELACDASVDLAMVFFVGAFDGNAFAAPYGNGRSAVCFPIENGEDDIVIVHELTHLVHGKLIGSELGWSRSVAALVFQEGLATQMSRHLIPGHPDEAYLKSEGGWLQSCCEDSSNILRGIRPYLAERSAEAMLRFTMGKGTTGRVREGYFAGWRLIGDMLADGRSFADIARIQEPDMVNALEKYI